MNVVLPLHRLVPACFTARNPLRIRKYYPENVRLIPGKSILFFHGAVGSPELMVELALHLATKHRAIVYAVCLPNHGGSPDVKTAPDFLAQIIAAADAEGIRDALAVGTYMGAWAGVHLMRLRPDIAAAGVALAMPGAPPRTSAERAVRVGAMFLDAVPGTVRATIEALVDGHILTLSRAFLQESLLPARTGYFNRILDSWPITQALVDALPGHLEVVNASGDRVVGPQVVSGSPNVTITTVDGGSHFWPLFSTHRGAIDDAVRRAFADLASRATPQRPPQRLSA